MLAAPMRIAMWSGPRNISTALMRSFESRGDTFVTDEPLYAHYLRETRLAHPMASEVLARHDSDLARVTEHLTGAVPDDRAIWYQKHMAHHLLAGDDRSWLDGLTHAFLIRDPAAMLPSLQHKLGEPRLADTGLPQQVEIYRAMRARGAAPPILDARDVLESPRRMLSTLCAALGIDYTDAMLSWRPGLRATDGVWASHWYDAVAASTGFAPPRHEASEVPASLRELEVACRELYDELHEDRLR